MLIKFFEEFSNINISSKKIITYGSFFSYFLLFCGISLIYSAQNTYMLFIGEETLKTSFLILTEIIIGGLFLDILQKNVPKD